MQRNADARFEFVPDASYGLLMIRPEQAMGLPSTSCVCARGVAGLCAEMRGSPGL